MENNNEVKEEDNPQNDPSNEIKDGSPEGEAGVENALAEGETVEEPAKEEQISADVEAVPPEVANDKPTEGIDPASEETNAVDEEGKDVVDKKDAHAEDEKAPTEDEKVGEDKNATAEETIIPQDEIKATEGLGDEDNIITGEENIENIEEYEEGEEVEKEGSDIEEGSHEEPPFVPTLPPKDYALVDPSFLDEFESSVEEVVKKEEAVEEEEEEIVEEVEEESDEDKYAVYDIPSPITTDLYADICALQPSESVDSAFSDAALSVRRKREKEVPKCPSTTRVNEINYLKSVAYPDLIRGLAEASLYRPARPLEFLSRWLTQAGKSREELGMDPDPREIQALVDRHERELERARRRRQPGFAPQESSSNASSLSGDPGTSRLAGVREKYRNDMEALKTMTSQRQRERIRLGGRQYRKNECLGPTSLVKGLLPAKLYRSDPPPLTNNK